jgi:hypothetical protein
MKLITISFVISAYLLAIGMGFAYAHFANLDAQVILHFDSVRGPDKFGSSQDVFLIVVLGMGLATINYFLARSLLRRDQLLPTVISLSSIFVSFLILISIFVIIANN